MQETEKKNTRGGRREGAGRPQGRADAKSITIRIPQDVVEILDRYPNKSAFIIEAIREAARK